MKRIKAIEWLYRDLPLLISNGIITQEAAQKIKVHYGEVKQKNKMNVALAIFGIIGAVCVGLGVILLFAYNWDNFTRVQRTGLAFLPLILSIVYLGWAVFKNKTSLAVREGSSVLNMLSVGAAIAMISQIYHIPGDFEAFMLTWMLLTLPLVYIMSATLTAILYLAGITTWAGCSQVSGGHALLFWPLVAVVIPYYFGHMKKDRFGSQAVWLTSALCLCLTVGIGISLEKALPGLWILIYSGFFAVLYLIGRLFFDDGPSEWQKPFRNYGMMGIVILSYLFSYEWVWHRIGWRFYRYGGRFHGSAAFFDYVLAIVLFIAVVALLVKAVGKKRYFECAFGVMPIVALLCYSYAASQGSELVTTWAFNLYVFVLGVICVLTGVKDKALGIMNGGILIMAVIIFTRFVDASLGILERAIIFIILGVCFIASNMYFSKKLNKEVLS